MQFASFFNGDAIFYGAVEDDTLHLAPQALFAAHPDLSSIIAGDRLTTLWKAARRDGEKRALADVSLAPVIPRPGKIICVGLNYRAHGDEKGRPDYPALFVRFPESQVGHGGPLLMSAESAQFDFEGELALVVGRAGHGIAEHDALAHVAGYTCYNDATMRDWQRHSTQYTAGKNFPSTGAFGPYLVAAGNVGDPGDLAIETRVDGVTMQSARTSDMLFSVPEIIAYVSRFTPLAPGDVIVTGTPAGAGAGRKPPVYLQPGNVVEVEIERVGLLRNVVAAPR